MELKPGYKQTEVGLIPEEWAVIRLEELSEFVTSGPRGWAKHYSDLGSLFVRSQNIRDGCLDFTDRQYVIPPGGAEVSRTRLNQNDLLITITGNSVGNIAWVEQEFGEAYISQHVGLVRLQNPSFAEYVCRFLMPGSPGNWQIWASQSGQSKPGLTLKDLGNFWIAFPPPLEQRSIAQALSDVDALIVALDKAIAKKRHLKTATMQQLLTGKKRLPGFGEGKGDRQTEIGSIPEDWDVVTIREITSLVTNGFVGKATDHYTDKDDGITYIQGYNVEANSFNFNGIKKVTSEFHRIHQKSCLRKDDLLTIQTGEVGLTTIVPDSLVGSNCHALIISRFKKEKAYPWFYAHYFNSPTGRLRLKDLEVGTTMMHINVGELLPWEVPCPPKLEEQRAIATVLSDMDAAIAALQTRLAKTQALKQGMMQQLLTGRVRLV